MQGIAAGEIEEHRAFQLVPPIQGVSGPSDWDISYDLHRAHVTEYEEPLRAKGTKISSVVQTAQLISTRGVSWDVCLVGYMD